MPVVCTGIALGAFRQQGGFGAGHLSLDPIIGWMGMPAMLFLERIPLPRWIEQRDLLLVIVVPALFNVLILWGPLAWFLLRLARRKPEARALAISHSQGEHGTGRA
ncbi:MAG: hypothetical protein HYY18_20535 [Planctomycetes bacterium]|nr:hypothetical protein [Planctomycetota bacterium]